MHTSQDNISLVVLEIIFYGMRLVGCYAYQ